MSRFPYSKVLYSYDSEVYLIGNIWSDAQSSLSVIIEAIKIEELTFLFEVQVNIEVEMLILQRSQASKILPFFQNVWKLLFFETSH